MADDILRNNVVNMLLGKKTLSSKSVEEIEEKVEPDVPQLSYHKKKVTKQEIEQTETSSKTDKLLEQLAALEHEQWWQWAEDILKTENIRSERAERWKKLFIPYEELSEEDKDQDRKWANKVLDIISDLSIEGTELIPKESKPKDLVGSLNKVFENQVGQEFKVSREDVENDIRISLGKNIRKDIFEAMF